MRKFLYPLIFSILAASCSSSSNVAPDIFSKTESNAANKITAVNPPSNAALDQTIPPPTSSDANRSDGNAAVLTNTFIDGSSVSRRNLERLRSKGGGDKNAAPIASSSPAPHVAPDKSEISSTMDNKGVPIETRVFVNHPTLAKTEKSFADAANPMTKVYLKNGKVLTVPKNVTIDHLKAPADDFLRAVGVNP